MYQLTTRVSNLSTAVFTFSPVATGRKAFFTHSVSFTDGSDEIPPGPLGIRLPGSK